MNFYLSHDRIEAVSRKALTEWNRDIFNMPPNPIPIENLIENTYGLDIDYCHITNNGRVLGKTIFDDGVTPYYDMDNHKYDLMEVTAGSIIIEASLLEDNSGRLRFTLAHELGHWLLHRQLFEGSGATPANLKTEQDSMIERQADAIAAHLLMPKGLIKKAYFEQCRTGCPEEWVTEKMANIFEVSKQAMKIRLKECGLGNR